MAKFPNPLSPRAQLNVTTSLKQTSYFNSAFQQQMFNCLMNITYQQIKFKVVLFLTVRFKSLFKYANTLLGPDLGEAIVVSVLVRVN